MIAAAVLADSTTAVTFLDAILQTRNTLSLCQRNDRRPSTQLRLAVAGRIESLPAAATEFVRQAQEAALAGVSWARSILALPQHLAGIAQPIPPLAPRSAS